MPSDPSPSGSPPRRDLGVIFLTIFIDLVGFSIIFPIFPALLDHYLATEGEQGLFGAVIAFLQNIHPGDTVGGLMIHAVLFGGLLGSLYSFLQFICAPFWGKLSDRLGRRTVLLYTVGGTALSYLLWLGSESFLFFILARLLSGAMAGNLAVATAAIADVTSRENRSRGMALVGIAFGLGFVMGPALGGLSASWNVAAWLPFAETIGYHPFAGPALLAFVLATLNWCWVYFRFAETLPPEKRQSAPRADRPSAKRFLDPAFPAAVRRTNLVFLCYIIAFSGMEFTLTFLAFERFAFSPRQMISIFLFVGFVIILTQGLIVRRLGPVWGEKPMALTGLSAVALGLLGIAFSGNLLMLFTSLFFLACGSGLINPAVSALISLYSPEETQGAALGVFRSLGALGRAIGPLLAALLFWWWGSTAAYSVGALLMIPPLLLALSLPPARSTGS